MKIQIFGPFLQQLRCGYIPYGDTNYFDKWFANTKEYLQLLKNQGTDVSQWKTTELSKLILAIEAIGYDPRDISSVDLLSAVGSRKAQNLLIQLYMLLMQ